MADDSMAAAMATVREMGRAMQAADGERNTLEALMRALGALSDRELRAVAAAEGVPAHTVRDRIRCDLIQHYWDVQYGQPSARPEGRTGRCGADE
jgi:hypothetical protein